MLGDVLRKVQARCPSELQSCVFTEPNPGLILATTGWSNEQELHALLPFNARRNDFLKTECDPRESPHSISFSIDGFSLE